MVGVMNSCKRPKPRLVSAPRPYMLYVLTLSYFHTSLKSLGV